MGAFITLTSLFNVYNSVLSEHIVKKRICMDIHNYVIFQNSAGCKPDFILTKFTYLKVYPFSLSISFEIQHQSFTLTCSDCRIGTVNSKVVRKFRVVKALFCIRKGLLPVKCQQRFQHKIAIASSLVTANPLFSTGDAIPGRVPGGVHTALLSHGVIKDPFYRKNDVDYLWVGRTDWTYYTTFTGKYTVYTLVKELSV